MTKPIDKAYIVTINCPLSEVHSMPLVEAFFVDKKAAKKFKAENIARQEVREICPTDYAIVILLGIGAVAITAKGFKHYQQVEEAIPSFKVIMPTVHFEIVQFCDTALYKKAFGTGGNND